MLFHCLPLRTPIQISDTLASLVGYIVAVVNAPHIFPPSSQYIIAVLGPTFAVYAPSMVFTFGMIVPVMMGTILLAMALSSLLVAASVVGTGLMVALFALFVFWFSLSKFAPGPAGTLGGSIMTIGALDTLGVYPYVQQSGRLSTIALLWQMPNGPTITLLINMLWALVICIPIAVLLPPVHTARYMFSQQMAPAALKDIAAHLRYSIQQAKETKAEAEIENEDEDVHPDSREGGNDNDSNTKHSIRNVGVETASPETADTSTANNQEEEYNKRVARLVKTSVSIQDGSIAMYVAYEPRFWRPLECDWIVLKNLLGDIQRTLATALSMPAQATQGFPLPSDYRDKVEFCATVLDECAAKLAKGTPDQVDPEEILKLKDESGQLRATFAERGQLAIKTERIVKSVNSWNAYVHGPYECPKSSKEALHNLFSNVTPYFAGLAGFIQGNLRVLFSACRPSYYQGRCKGFRMENQGAQIVWYFKFTAGMVALFCMSVYWDAWRQIEVPVQSFDGATSYSGWHLLGYALATTPTVQGTIKKGTLRLGGTVVGGFSGWLAIKACGEYPHTNTAGFIVWVTVTTFFVSLGMLTPGPMSKLGLRKDSGFLGMYFVMTQAIVGFEAYYGVLDINYLTANRIIATGTGVLMAMTMAILPPTVNGGNPLFAKEMLRFEKECLAAVIQATLEGDVEKMNLNYNAKMAEFQKWHNLATLLYTDASQLLPQISCMGVDERLSKEMDRATILAGLLLVVKETCEFAVQEQQYSAEQWDLVRDTLNNIAESLLSDGTDKITNPQEIDDGGLLLQSLQETGSCDSLFLICVRQVQLLATQLYKTEDNLSHIEHTWYGKNTHCCNS
jgi:hypothetical protein